MQTEDILGAAFHPLDDNLMITYGKGHLTFWTRRKDGFFEKIDIIKSVIHLKLMFRISYIGLYHSIVLDLAFKNSSYKLAI